VARAVAGEAPVPIEVVPGVADRLPAGEAEFDAGVVSLVLCSVPDQGSALAELSRVIRPGGELRFYEHVVSQGRFARQLQKLADLTLWPHLAGGCHMARDTEQAILEAGFDIETSRRFSFAPQGGAPRIPHILGRALRQPQPGRYP
jgi:ubiquinone/menaquinone biosynthesis C-methylase UbiE